MANSDINDTAPYPIAPDGSDPGLTAPFTPEPVPASAPKKRKRWPLVVLVGILIFLLLFAGSAYAGYNSGITQRKQAESALVSAKAAEQFDLAVQDINSGNNQRARQRLEYIAQLDPNYPGLTDNLAVVLARINATATPTPEPSPTPTLVLTPIIGEGSEAIFSQAQQLIFNSDWTGAIDTLLDLRKTDPAYKAVQIDGLLFLALRNRGLEKIARQADLEGGLYDLTLASRFGPIDSEAQGYITWTSLYITGASFWELDWAKVVEYFSQIGPALPGLTDRSGWTARGRFRLGLKGLGTQLADAGDFCAAADQYQLSLSVGTDPEVELLFNEAYTACQGGVTEESAPSVEATVPPPAGTLPPVDATSPPPVETTSPPPVETTPPPPVETTPPPVETTPAP